MPITSRSFVRATVLLLVVGFMSVLAIVVAAVLLADRNDRHADDLIDALAARREAFMVENLALDAETGQRGYLLTHEEAYLEPYRDALAGIEKQLGELRRLAQSQPQYAESVEEIARTIGDKLTELNETIELTRSGRGEAAVSMLRADGGRKAMDTLRAATGSLTTTTDTLVELYTAELRESAGQLLWVLAAGGFAILGIVGASSWLAWRYTRDLEAARLEMMALNATLEERVRERTADVREQRDRAETLLREVNHRVGNSLALVGALVRMQSSMLDEPAAIGALKEAQTRINAIARLHKQLYTSDDVRVVAIGPFIESLLGDLETTMRDEGSPHSVRVGSDDLVVATDKAVSIGVVVTELVTNAYKYAYPAGAAGEIRVIIQKQGDQARVMVEDDGAGWDGTGAPTGTGLGSQIVNAMATNLRAELTFNRLQPGTRVLLIFSV